MAVGNSCKLSPSAPKPAQMFQAMVTSTIRATNRARESQIGFVPPSTNDPDGSIGSMETVCAQPRIQTYARIPS
eukprot:m.254493 g.254493  ORF g.254493 m.254493 type:complete len:74 (-) comp17554_c0_seq6:640-861(-)